MGSYANTLIDAKTNDHRPDKGPFPPSAPALAGLRSSARPRSGRMAAPYKTSNVQLERYNNI